MTTSHSDLSYAGLDNQWAMQCVFRGKLYCATQKVGSGISGTVYKMEAKEPDASTPPLALKEVASLPQTYYFVNRRHNGKDIITTYVKRKNYDSKEGWEVLKKYEYEYIKAKIRWFVDTLSLEVIHSAKKEARYNQTLNGLGAFYCDHQSVKLDIKETSYSYVTKFSYKVLNAPKIFIATVFLGVDDFLSFNFPSAHHFLFGILAALDEMNKLAHDFHLSHKDPHFCNFRVAESKETPYGYQLFAVDFGRAKEWKPHRELYDLHIFAENLRDYLHNTKLTFKSKPLLFQLCHEVNSVKTFRRFFSSILSIVVDEMMLFTPQEEKEFGIKVNFTSKEQNGRTFLHKAAWCNNLKALKFIKNIYPDAIREIDRLNLRAADITSDLECNHFLRSWQAEVDNKETLLAARAASSVSHSHALFPAGRAPQQKAPEKKKSLGV